MIKFGTGGWRAIIGDDFTKKNICLVGQALADRIINLKQEDIPVIIGYDRRFLSEQASKWLAGVLAGNGIQVFLMHRSSPTPMTMHAVLKRKLEYGLEVTASHNPYLYNGIKIIVREGRDAPVDVTSDIEKRILGITEIKEKSIESAEREGIITYPDNLFNDYIDDILSQLDQNAIRDRGLRILFNPMHGSGTYPFEVIFNTTRCTLDLINDNKDAYFGSLLPAPTEETLRDLKNGVLKGRYDIGLAVDGDGDRLGVIDSDGSYISANKILVLLYYYLHEYKGMGGPVVRNLATTHLLDRIAKSFGEMCYEVPIGFKFISSEIDRVNAVLGGESSGGLTVRGHIHGKDSAYSAALFVEMICKTGKSPCELIREIESKFGCSEFVEYNFELPIEKKERLAFMFKEMQGKIPSFDNTVLKLNYSDGCKVYFTDDSFVICRPSGTEDIIRIMAEADSKEKCRKYIKAWKDYIDLL